MLKVCEPLALAHIMTVTWHYRWELGRENNVSPQLVEGDPLLLTMVSLDISFVSLSFLAQQISIFPHLTESMGKEKGKDGPSYLNFKYYTSLAVARSLDITD